MISLIEKTYLYDIKQDRLAHELIQYDIEKQYRYRRKIELFLKQTIKRKWKEG